MKKNKKLFFLFITTLVVTTIFVFVVLTNQKHLPSATIGTIVEPINGYLVNDIKKEKILLNKEFKNENEMEMDIFFSKIKKKIKTIKKKIIFSTASAL